MRSVLRYIGVLLLLALLWTGLVLSEWLPRPTAAQRAALALLDSPRASVSGEHNAFAALWLFGYDMPDAELDAVAAADVAAYQAAVERDGIVADFKSGAEGRYPELPRPALNDPALCEVYANGCLERVRSNPDGSRAVLAQFAQRLQRSGQLARYDHYRSGFLQRYDAPFGTQLSGLLPLQATAAALDFVDGRVDAAFERVCRDAATWRRLRAHSDSLIVDIIGVAQLSGAARLYAEMLADLPPDRPAPCPDTFAPLADAELDQCAAMRGEFLIHRNSLHDMLHAGLDPVFADLGALSAPVAWLVNEQNVVRGEAVLLARSCGEASARRIQARDAAPLVAGESCTAIAWLADPLGCSLLRGVVEAASQYEPYYHRVLDLDGVLKLVQTAVWLRTQPADADLARRFAERPAALHSPAHRMDYDAASQRLRMTNLYQVKSERWEIPVSGMPVTPP